MGYKANITESVENRMITNIMAMRGNRRDEIRTGDDHFHLAIVARIFFVDAVIKEMMEFDHIVFRVIL